MADILNHMHKMLLALLLAGLSPAQTPGSAKTAVLATVHQFADAFNKGDTKAAAAACAEQTSILDEFPPHEWHGTGACGKWMSAYAADAEKNGITEGIVTLNKPSHVDINSDHAYVVIPVNYAFKQKGKPFEEIGSILTLTLENRHSGWRINGWAWAKH